MSPKLSCFSSHSSVNKWNALRISFLLDEESPKATKRSLTTRSSPLQSHYLAPKPFIRNRTILSSVYPFAHLTTSDCSRYRLFNWRSLLSIHTILTLLLLRLLLPQPLLLFSLLSILLFLVFSSFYFLLFQNCRSCFNRKPRMLHPRI